MIIETTKQDELDEIRFKSQQEIDSLNHIISNPVPFPHVILKV